MTLEVSVHGLEEALRKVDPAVLRKPMRRFFQRATILVSNRAKIGAPVDTGRLRASLVGEVDTAQVPLFGKVGSNVHYAPYQEYGTGSEGDPEVPHKPRHWPPGHALGVWASRHGFSSGFQVARIIGKRGGLRPRRFLRDALDQSEGQIEGFFDGVGLEIQREWDRD